MRFERLYHTFAGGSLIIAAFGHEYGAYLVRASEQDAHAPPPYHVVLLILQGRPDAPTAAWGVVRHHGRTCVATLDHADLSIKDVHFAQEIHAPQVTEDLAIRLLHAVPAAAHSILTVALVSHWLSPQLV
jgi:hypothetical protein